MQPFTLNASHIPDCLKLSDAAGWNQTELDWSLMISSGHGFGVVDELAAPDSLIATAVLFPYPPSHAWISMVLVRSDWQRRGLATQLLNKCINLAEELKLTPLLDATPAGKHVYEKRGFDSCFTISRFVLDGESTTNSGDSLATEQLDAAYADGGNSQAEGEEKVQVEAGSIDAMRLESARNHSQEEGTISMSRISRNEVSELANEDKDIFGANRKPVISMLLQHYPDLARKITNDKNEMVGYVLGREGRSARHIGPLIANSESVALTLVGNLVTDVLRTAEGRVVMIDVPDVHASFQEALVSSGFNRKRRFTRMQYGGGQPFGNYEKIFAIGGPEIG